QLKSEIGRVAETTNFNGTKLLDGSFTAQSFQVGANQGETIDIANIANASANALGTWVKADATYTQTTDAPAVTDSDVVASIDINGVTIATAAGAGNATAANLQT